MKFSYYAKGHPVKHLKTYAGFTTIIHINPVLINLFSEKILIVFYYIIAADLY